jgi:hypothetical protein
MTFTKWLLMQSHRSDLVGELAQTVRRQEDWPSRCNDLLPLRVYLARDSATPLALKALEVAFDEWYRSKDLPEINVLFIPSYGQLS